MDRIGVLTSGGDLSGINAAFRAVVGRAHKDEIEIVDFHDGWLGMLENRSELLGMKNEIGR